MNYLKISLLTLLFLYSSSLYSQISDDFSDGNITTSPTWLGDDSSFVVNSQFELQLNASVAGSRYLMLTCNPLEGEMEWQFKIQLAFSPSSNNFARVYLAFNQININTPNETNGFYLQFGESGSADAVELFYQQGNTIESICRSENGEIANSFQMMVKVVKDVSDSWFLYTDASCTGFYQLKAVGNKHFDAEQAGFGLACTFTASYKDKFYFDDFYYGMPIEDTIRPQILHLFPQENLHGLIVEFSENVLPETALNSLNYQLDNGISPLTCSYTHQVHNRVYLSFIDEMLENIEYKIIISGVQDMAGNEMERDTLFFHYHRIRPNDIIISEIMSDPSPTVGLPNIEYIELHNCTDELMLLEGWKIVVGNSIKELPPLMMEGNSYLLVVSNSNLEIYKDIVEHVVGVSSLSITDDGQLLVLYNAEDEVIHKVQFRKEWHRSVIKRNGGWSLEMIDTANPCGEFENWDSSESPLGGTPGTQNSIQAYYPDIVNPQLIAFTLLSKSIIQVCFNEFLVIDDTLPLNCFSINNQIEIIDIELVKPYNNCFQITFADSLNSQVIYTLTVQGLIQDCAGNEVVRNSKIRFGIDELPTKNDLIINELLTNPPLNDEGDFVELYNRSDKIIDLKNVLIGSGGDDIPDKSSVAYSAGYQMFPKQYIVLCKNRRGTLEYYNCKYPMLLLQNDSLPPFNNSEGVVHITDKSFYCIDKFHYSEEMHNVLLRNVDGVSLERVNFDVITDKSSSWKSAAATAGFGTPGYINSQYLDINEITSLLEVYPDVISPDNDGFEDYAFISCSFSESENNVSVTIFDQYGNIVKLLVNNDICGTNELFVWDGTKDDGTIAPWGMYIVELKVWNKSGTTNRSRKVVGLIKQ